MGDETAAVETCLLAGLWVPTSLVDLIEKWASRTRDDATDVVRSLLNLGLAHYVQMYPQSVPQMAKAMGDLDRMAPERARRFRLDALERADGRLTLRCAEPEELDAVVIEAAAQPKLAALLKAHAERGSGTIGNMLLELWCVETLTHYCTKGDDVMVSLVLDAWEEQGIPSHMIDAVKGLTGHGEVSDGVSAPDREQLLASFKDIRVERIEPE